MSRITKDDILKRAMEAGSIQTPTLSKHFKYVFVGCIMKNRIEVAKRKARIDW